MGADAEIHLFDYQRYRTQVVAPLTGLLRTGTPGPWLTGWIHDQAGRAGVTGFEQHWPVVAGRLSGGSPGTDGWCPLLGEDLRYLPGERGDGVAPPVYDITARGAITCSSPHCRYHEDGSPARQILAELYEALLAGCLGAARFVGRSRCPCTYGPLFDELHVAPADPVRRLVGALGSRGTVVGYTYGVTEGVHGWLTEAETADLAERLGALPLPAYEPSFDTMSSLHAGNLDDTVAGLPTAGADWERLSLSFVRTVAVLAAADGKAVLWGNDVGSVDGWIDVLLVD